MKWYKGTSEWPIKPSKFFKPKSDGTKHQLFILEAYAEDEGLPSRVPSVVRLLGVSRSLQMCGVESSGYHCDDGELESGSYVDRWSSLLSHHAFRLDAMQVPEFVHGFSNLNTYEGEQVRFEVEVRGDPPPTISWFRDGEVIRDSPDFQVSSLTFFQDSRPSSVPSL